MVEIWVNFFGTVMNQYILLLSAAALGGCGGLPLTANSGAGLQTAGQSERVQKILFVTDGNIDAVHDGDTLTFKAANGTPFDVRLSDTDAPEIFQKAEKDKDCACKPPAERPGQKFAREATAALSALAPVGSPATAECYRADRYGKMVCHVYVNGVNLNLEQLRRGWAMTPKKAIWVRDPASRVAQDEAKTARRGIWQDAQAVHPDDWRENCWDDGQCGTATK